MDLHFLNAARTVRLLDENGVLIAHVPLGAFSSAADGSASSKPTTQVRLDAQPAWAELLDNGENVIVSGPVEARKDGPS
jgi:hypothetical protein